MKKNKFGAVIKIVLAVGALQTVPAGLVWAADVRKAVLDTENSTEGLDDCFKYSNLQNCTTVSEQHVTANVEHQSELQSLQERNYLT